MKTIKHRLFLAYIVHHVSMRIQLMTTKELGEYGNILTVTDCFENIPKQLIIWIAKLMGNASRYDKLEYSGKLLVTVMCWTHSAHLLSWRQRQTLVQILFQSHTSCICSQVMVENGHGLGYRLKTILFWWYL